MENSGLRLNLDTESWVAITEQNRFNNEVLSCCLAWYGSTVSIFAIVSASGMYCKAEITTLPANKGSFRLPLFCSSSSITDNAVTSMM